MNGTKKINVSIGPADGKERRLGRALARWITLNPLLVLALAALILRFGLPLVLSGFSEGVAGMLWTGASLWLRPFSLVATWVDPYLRGFPEYVDVVGTLLLGLVPYVVVDAVYRVLMQRRLRTL
jgi:hypothetical protein